jgi:hypothetical protein
MAQGLMALKQGYSLIEGALPSLDGEAKKAALRALSVLNRHLPQGAPSAGVQQTQIGDLMRNTMRNSLLQRLMGQGQGQGQRGGQGPGSATPGLPTPPPMPITPMPGA